MRIFVSITNILSIIWPITSVYSSPVLSSEPFLEVSSSLFQGVVAHRSFIVTETYLGKIEAYGQIFRQDLTPHFREGVPLWQIPKVRKYEYKIAPPTGRAFRVEFFQPLSAMNKAASAHLDADAEGAAKTAGCCLR